MRVERPAHGFDREDAGSTEDVEDLGSYQGHSPGQRAFIGLLQGGVQGPLQVVQDRQQLAGEGGQGFAPFLGEVR